MKRKAKRPTIPALSAGPYFGLVDSHRATKDYLNGGRCVRIIAVEHKEFSERALEEGVRTFTVDIDFWAFCQREFLLESWRAVHARQASTIEARDDDPEMTRRWYRLELDFNSTDGGYIYETFSEAAPRRFGIASLLAIGAGPRVPEPPRQRHGKTSSDPARLSLLSRIPGTSSAPPHPSRGKPYTFDTFHVGQGMCSLVHNGDHGVLLDAGAGKPVTRKAYLAKTLKNELITSIVPLSTLCAVISHADSDHWRLLSWDLALRNKVDRIYVPLGARSLALRDRAVLRKIIGISTQRWQLDVSSSLLLLRSIPKHVDSNGDCLVAIFDKQGKKVLGSGDYVYKRFSTDGNPRVTALPQERYRGLVVPHHGDAASAQAVPTSDTPNAIAFFSAGTHQGYKHPDPTSLASHQSASFHVVSDPKQTDIVSVKLL